MAPLAQQPVTVPLAGGLNTKLDPKQVQVGQVLLCENAVYTKIGKLMKRPGYEALSTEISGGGHITTARKLATYQSELCLMDGSSFYSYDQSSNTWLTKGSFVGCSTSVDPVVRNTYQQTAQDGTVHSIGLHCFAWEDSRGGVRYSIQDTATNHLIVADALIDAGGSRPKVIAFGRYFLVFYVVASALYVTAIPVGTPATPATPYLVYNGLSADKLYDVTVMGSRAYVAYVRSLPAVDVTYFDLNLNQVATVTNAGVYNPDSAIAVIGDPVLQRIYVAGALAASGIDLTSWDYGLSAQGAVHSIAGAAAYKHLTGLTMNDSNSDLWLYYSIGTTDRYVSKVRVLNGVVGSPAVVSRSVDLAAKPFLYNGAQYLVLSHDSALQSTYFVMDRAGTIVAKALSGVGGGYHSRATLPETSWMEAGMLMFGALEKDALETSGVANVYTQTGVDHVLLDFTDSDDAYNVAELANTLHISSGYGLAMYDGISPVEHGFLLFPEGLSVTSPGGTNHYQYVATYEWTDGKGQVHRSSPSLALAYADNTPIAGGHTVSVTVPTLRVTMKRSTRTPVTICLYRTLANETNFYLVSTITSPTFNDPTVDSVTITDGIDDATLQGKAQLYTTGGVIENIPANPMGSLTVHANRIFGVDTTNPLKVWYSKQVIPGQPLEMSDLQVMNVDPRGGGVTALGTLDDKLVLFKATRIFATAGLGPAPTGIGDDLGSGQLVQSDGGCTHPHSVAIVPDGLMYKSPKGIYLLNRSLTVSYIGAPVEAYNSLGIVATNLMPDTTQVRFMTDGGVALVYDYLVDRWSVFTPLTAASAAVFQGVYTYVRPDGQVRKETPGLYSDVGRYIKLRAKTSWLQFAGLDGFERVYRAYVLGTYLGGHKLTVGFAYDFNPSVQHSVTTDIQPLLGGTAYGQDTPYGSGSPYGGTFPLYQWRVDLKRQTFSALQITIEDDESTDGQVEALDISALTLMAGIKQGGAKRPVGRILAAQ